MKKVVIVFRKKVGLFVWMVRLGGLEPPRREAQAPQACVSTIPPQPHCICISREVQMRLVLYHISYKYETR